jgi:hypothetical protein
MGFEVQVHPNLSGDRKTHPDLLALKDGQRCFYLEATLAGPSGEGLGEQARIKQVYDILNEMRSPNFFVGIRLWELQRRPLQVNVYVRARTVACSP